jgi:hypothetical protein
MKIYGRQMSACMQTSSTSIIICETGVKLIIKHQHTIRKTKKKWGVVAVIPATQEVETGRRKTQCQPIKGRHSGKPVIPRCSGSLNRAVV